MQTGSKRYRAFISYSQKDKAWAKKLHQALETYRLPLGVVADVDPTTRTMGRIFRDDEEMGASESLGKTLEGALDESQTLIVLCSPHSAQSPWVDMEVRRFKQRPDARVFAVIIEGAPNSGDPETECFCPSLRFQVTPDGQLTDIPDEPLAPDWKKDGLARLKARLSAGILGVSFDDLWQRDKRRQAQRRMLAGGLGLLALIGAGIFYWRVQSKITRLDPVNQYENFVDWYYALYREVRFDEVPDIRYSEQDGNDIYIESEIEADPNSGLTRDEFQEEIQIVRRDDMNDDGFVDFFSYVSVMEFCGTGGCPQTLFIRDDDGYREVWSDFNDEDIEILGWKSQGYRDFLIQVGQFNDDTPIFALNRFDGEVYMTIQLAVCDFEDARFCSFESKRDGFANPEQELTLFTPLELLTPEESKQIMQRLDRSTKFYDTLDWAQKGIGAVEGDSDLYGNMAVSMDKNFVLAIRDWGSRDYLVHALSEGP